MRIWIFYIIAPAFFGCLLQLSYPAVGQNTYPEVKRIKTVKEYRQSIGRDSSKIMVNLKDLILGLLVDMPYATKTNFTKTQLYPTSAAFMRKGPATALKKVQEQLAKSGLCLKVWDAYRPFSVTCRMWRLTPDKHFVCNPKTASNHNRGAAVDLTIADLKTGKELDMGTGFDSFSDTAASAYSHLPPKVLENRKLLARVMREAGFRQLKREWWHFNWAGAEKYEVLDLDFEQIPAINPLGQIERR